MRCCILLAGGEARPGALLGEILPWLIALVVIVIVGGVALYALRRSLGRDAGAAEGFTLQDLRELHATGQLTDEEFERARSAIIGRVTESPEAGTPGDGESGGEDDGGPPSDRNGRPHASDGNS